MLKNEQQSVAAESVLSTLLVTQYVDDMAVLLLVGEPQTSYIALYFCCSVVSGLANYHA